MARWVYIHLDLLLWFLSGALFAMAGAWAISMFLNWREDRRRDRAELEEWRDFHADRQKIREFEDQANRTLFDA